MKKTIIALVLGAFVTSAFIATSSPSDAKGGQGMSKQQKCAMGKKKC